MIDIKACVRHPVEFSHYTQGNLYYITVNGDIFAVPIDDAGEATFLDTDKGMLFMRYMRKHNAQYITA